MLHCLSLDGRTVTVGGCRIPTMRPVTLSAEKFTIDLHTDPETWLVAPERAGLIPGFTFTLAAGSLSAKRAIEREAGTMSIVAEHENGQHFEEASCTVNPDESVTVSMRAVEPTRLALI
jgi:hypothetical protein